VDVDKYLGYTHLEGNVALSAAAAAAADYGDDLMGVMLILLSGTGIRRMAAIGVKQCRQQVFSNTVAQFFSRIYGFTSASEIESNL